MDKKNNEVKMSLRRIIANTFYVLKYAMKMDKSLILTVMISFCVVSVGSALFNTVFIKVMIDMLTNDSSITKIIVVLVVGLAGMSILRIIEAVTDQWSEIRLVKATGNIQRIFIKKSAEIDLMCYDHPEYFDDFVIAASQSDTMIRQSIYCTTYILGNSLSILSVSGLIMTINPVIALFPIIGFFFNIITRFAITKLEYNYDMDRMKIRRKADYSKRVFYQPEYAKEIKLSGIERPLRTQFNTAILEEQSIARKYGWKIAILSLVNWITVYTFLSFFCIPLYLGYYALVKMSIALGDVASMNNAANTIRERLDATNYALIEFQKVGQYAERFRRFVEYEEKIENFKGKIAVPETVAPLEIKNMSFKYDGCEDYTLKNINMMINPGEKIAIVGENGAGKTTFVKLLMRLYDVTEGAIVYGDNNIKDYTTKEYRHKIGAVFQDYQLYAATLGENVLMDFYDDVHKDRVENALQLADFGRKLDKLSLGVNTELTREFSDEGTMLSGGESQKIAISRMFAHSEKLPVAILDEPSSALDPIAEYTLNTNMMESAKESTVIFISHRLSTTRSANRIYMFEHGEIIEEGTHDELMALGGEYAAMFEKQAHYYKLSI